MKNIIFILVTSLFYPASATEIIIDNFLGDKIDSTIWTIANGWGNGNFTSTYWLESQVKIQNNNLILELSNQPCTNTPTLCKDKLNASAEVRSKQTFGNSYVHANIKTAKGEGLITALFKYTGPYDGNPHDEIDMEFLGKAPNQVRLNYWVNGKSKLEKVINLGFDSSSSFHHYGWEQTSNSIKWYVDNKLVHSVTTANAEELPTQPGRIMLSLWASQPGSTTDRLWAGSINNTILPVYASFNQLRVGHLP